jgi:phosphoribosylaminoimidazolecarboxamide formyltransferase/IMP cyclohydrolase
MINLKYGCNPHQKTANVRNGDEQYPGPIKILNANPGYINLLDALNAWQLVKELDEALSLPAATSFKHVSPAGAAVAGTLEMAYKLARDADPRSSFGDFIALSRTVDKATATYIKTTVSDGVIAPGFDDDALEILKTKKDGKYIILSMNPEYEAPKLEIREVYGLMFTQERNTIKLNEETLLHTCVTYNDEITEQIKQDLILASIVLKYTQSNSVGYAKNGMMLGIGAGQQSRIDCTILAGEKTKGNGRYQLTDLSLSSDAFFPFSDNIEVAHKHGVKYIVQTGGSNRDKAVIETANKYNMVMYFSGIRLFHH